MAGIRFNTQDITFKLKHPRLVSKWLETIARRERAGFESLTYIFCSDDFLLAINKSHLNHDDLTDIITFDLTDPGKSRRQIEAEIYISIPRVKENSALFKVPFETELHRVMVHGVLHLCGYGDKAALERALMREKEDASLSLRRFHVEH